MTPTRRAAIGIGVFVLAYAVLSYAGLQWVSVTTPVSQVWPAAGAAVAALLLGGVRLWPAVFVGSLVATSLDPGPYSMGARAIMAAGNSFGTVAAVWLMRRLGMDPGLRRPRDVLYLAFVGGLGSGVLTGLAAVGGMLALGELAADAAPGMLTRWALGDLLGVVVVAPAVLAWLRPEPLPRDGGWWTWFALLAATVCMLGWAAYVAADHPGGIYPVHVVPVMILTAFVLDVRATSAIILLNAAAALYGALTGAGPSRGGELFGDEQFVMVSAFTLTLVSVMVETLRRARAAMENQRLYRLTAENEERLRMSQEIGRVGSWDWDVRLDRAVVTPTYREMFGWPADKPTFRLMEWTERIHPDDRERTVAALRECAETGRPIEISYRILLPSGEVRHVEGRGQAVEWEGGRPVRLIGVAVDVTDRKLAEERQRLLMREVDHRAKNALAVVQAVVRLTKADTQAAFAAAVEGRIQAIARAHNLLAASRWTGASLRKLVDEEIEPYQGQGNDGRARVRADGPDVTLEPDAAQPLALVLHELVTNAAKHGALSTPRGTVEVGWTLDRENDRLHVDWREAGGPKVAAPSRNGFGSTLISASVERQLHGELRQDWRPEGLHATLEIPLGRATGAGGAGAPPGEGAAAMLLVEDEALIGLDMKERLQALGWRVLGPVSSVEEAMRAAETVRPAAALLDVNLGGQSSAPLAKRLEGMGVPFAFATGYGDYLDGAAEFHAPVLIKPATTEELKQALDTIGARPTAAH